MRDRLSCCYRDEKMTVYAGAVYSVLLKQVVLAAFVYYGGKEKPEIITCTDAEIQAKTMYKYYGMRFQVEFLIWDAKQRSGLEDCMAGDENKLHTHSNIAINAVSISKIASHLSLPAALRGSFSMADITMWYVNRLINQKIFSDLASELSRRKIKRIFNHCLNFGRDYPDKFRLRS